MFVLSLGSSPTVSSSCERKAWYSERIERADIAEAVQFTFETSLSRYSGSTGTSRASDKTHRYTHKSAYIHKVLKG